MKEQFESLTESEAQELFRKYGDNDLRESNKLSLLSLLLVQYKNVITVILLIAAIFSFSIGQTVDSFFIGAVLVLNGIFGFVQQFRAEKTLEKLRGLSSPTARVVREGEEKEIEARLLVVGDLVSLREGDRIPADGKILSDIVIEIDEAVLTGESLPIEKSKGDEILSGTFIVKGKGFMVVTSTGYDTRLGKMAKELVNVKKPKTPLSQNLDDLGKKFAFIGMFFALLLIPIGIFQGREVRQLILTAINLAVAVVPEGLPLVVTVSLAVGAYRLAKEKTIVRKMAAIETLGATTAILSDKTGTITQNKMSVKEHWLANEEKLPILVRSCVVGNAASLVLEEDPFDQAQGKHGGVEILGDRTDGALLMFAKAHVVDFDEYRQEGKLISEKPFDPDTKTIQAVWEDKDVKHEFVRGAPESIFRLTGEDAEGEAVRKFEEMLGKGFRVIGFAKKNHNQEKFSLLGLIGIYDPPREEAKEAIRQAKLAGIRVVMVTGDNAKTALHIAEEIGMIEEGEIVFSAQDLEKTSDEDLLPMLSRIKIFARMKPEDKLRLVRLYRKAGFVVAVTGDGVNDALALSEANIGVSMGKTGTDVAKEAADVIITDDNLFTIIKAVEEGRGIFDNIVKVVVFLFSSNIAELLLIFLAIIFALPIPLTVTQILWVNLVGDSLPALALAMDTKRKKLLLNKPRNVSENVLNPKRFLYILKITIPFVLILMTIYYFALQNFSHEVSQLIVFNALVIGEMFIVFVVRKGLFPLNKLLIFSIIVTLLLQALTFLNPFLRNLLS